MKENKKSPLTNVSVRLIGENGNAFNILGKVRAALRKAGYDSEFIEEFGRKATSGDYNHLLAVVSEYVNIE